MAPAKATLVNAAASSSACPPSSGKFTGEFFDIYNDVLAAKSELLVSNAGAERKQAIGELEESLVRLFIILSLQARLIPFLDKMAAHSSKDWKIPNLQSMAGWANELSVIQSSTVAKHHQILAECDACLSSLINGFSEGRGIVGPSSPPFFDYDCPQSCV